MYLYDTNIFLEILLGQQHAATAKKALEQMSHERRGTVTSFSLHAIEAILEHRTTNLLEDFLDSIQAHPYLDRHETTTQEEMEISQLTKQLTLDFDDALQYYVAKKLNATLVTFDKHFKNITDIEVVYPSFTK